MAKAGIIGAGSWGIALSVLLHNNGHDVKVWSAIKEEIEMLNKEREHKTKLPSVKLSQEIIFTDDISEAVQDADFLVMAVPSPYVRTTCKTLKPFVKEGTLIVNVAKGIEDNTFYTITEIIDEELKGVNSAVLSGPSHAEEVGRGIPTTCVAGAKTKETAEYIQDIFMSEVFRVYTSPDVLGIELGGALKNVIALAAGMADGLGYGDNTKAALITRGIAEITRLGVAMGGNRETFSGLTGMGDLIVTCASLHSRNRKAGMLIGQGMKMDEAMKEVKMVVEGVYSAKAAKHLAQKLNISMPIVEEVNKILFEDKPAEEAVKELMIRDKKIEHSDLPWK